METPGFHYFFLYRPKSALGLVGLVGWLGASLGSFYSAGSFRSFHQGLRSGGSGLARPPSAGCATGRAESKRMAHHPSSDREEESCFPSWYGTRPSARSGKQLLTAQNSGVIPKGGGRPLLWRFFRLFLIAEKETLRSKPRPASLCCWEMEKIRPSPSVLDEAERVPLPFGVVLDKIEKNKP